MSQNDERHMMVPLAPETQFILVHSQFPQHLAKQVSIGQRIPLSVQPPGSRASAGLH